MNVAVSEFRRFVVLVLCVATPVGLAVTFVSCWIEDKVEERRIRNGCRRCECGSGWIRARRD
jgi:hypothetical protein